MAEFRVLRAVILATILVLLPVSHGEAATVTWDASAVASAGGTANDFDSATFLFPGFYADTLTSVSGPGFAHDHGLDRIFSMSIVLNGVPTEVGNTGPTGGSYGYAPLSLIPSLSFKSGIVTGILLSVDFPVNQAFHNMIGTQFTFAAQTPLPAALPLFATGLGVAGLLRWRSKRKAAMQAAAA